MTSPPATQSMKLAHVRTGYCVACGSRCRYKRRRKRVAGPGPIVVTPPPCTDFTKDEMVLLRSRWEEWKGEYGIRGGEFRDALDSLLNLHGYSMTDVSLFLGLSRERIRQYVSSFGITIEAKGAQYRVWDNEANRFVSVGGSGEYKDIERSISGPLARKRNMRAKRRNIARWVLIDLGADLERVPAHADLAEAYRIEAGQLNGRLGIISNRGLSITTQCEKLWADAGYDEYPNMAKVGLGRPGMLHHTHDRFKTPEELAERYGS